MALGRLRPRRARTASTAFPFTWSGREEGLVYAAAAVTYVALGVGLQTVVLNWIMGPLYFVAFVAGASWLLARYRTSSPGRS